MTEVVLPSPIRNPPIVEFTAALKPIVPKGQHETIAQRAALSCDRIQFQAI